MSKNFPSFIKTRSQIQEANRINVLKTPKIPASHIVIKLLKAIDAKKILDYRGKKTQEVRRNKDKNDNQEICGPVGWKDVFKLLKEKKL